MPKANPERVVGMVGVDLAAAASWANRARSTIPSTRENTVAARFLPTSVIDGPKPRPWISVRNDGGALSLKLIG